MSDLTTEDRDRIAQALRTCMEGWSETRWCATWEMNLENELWEEVIQGREPAMEALARLSGYWWTYENRVPLDEWRERYSTR